MSDRKVERRGEEAEGGTAEGGGEGLGQMRAYGSERQEG